MNVYQKRDIFRRRNESNVYRMFLWIILILGGVWLIRSVVQGDVKPLFLPTPTPTRFAQSYAIEGDALFTAGKLNDVKDVDGNVISPGAITALREAVKVDPNNAKVWADLARVQTYSTQLLVNQAEILTRLDEALVSAETALEINPDDSYVHAVYTLALNWKASYIADDRERQTLLSTAEREAARALQLDNSNALALAFYAEVLVDQQRWTQGQQYIDQALALDSTLMDVHRVHAYVLESLAEYALAIEAYNKAIAISPNLTFLYIRAGANYRTLAFNSPNEQVQTELFEKSLEYFDKAARINDQLGVQDPGPYLSIARTYSQMGQFFIAIRNVQKTIEFQPDKAEFYGELGVLYHKNRNYETGILALECAVRGCDEDGSCEGRGGCGPNDTPSVVEGLPISASTIYYYDVYASELAALSTPKKNYCDEALAIADIIEASEYDEDPNIAADVVVVRNICNSLLTGVDLNATATPEVMIDSTPTTTP